MRKSLMALAALLLILAGIVVLRAARFTSKQIELPAYRGIDERISITD